MDEEDSAKEEAPRVRLDESLRANNKILNQKERTPWKELALFVIGLSILSGAFAFDQVYWLPFNTGGPLQLVDRQVYRCFPTAATQTAMLAKGTKLDQWLTLGESGGSWDATWQNIYSKDQAWWGSRLEPVNSVEGMRAFCGYQWAVTGTSAVNSLTDSPTDEVQRSGSTRKPEPDQLTGASSIPIVLSI